MGGQVVFGYPSEASKGESRKGPKPQRELEPVALPTKMQLPANTGNNHLQLQRERVVSPGVEGSPSGTVEDFETQTLQRV